MEATQEQLAQAEKHDEKAAENLRKKEESFQRCDTDGFLSQWALGLTANLESVKAEILRDGGKAEFPVLFDFEGNRQDAKLIDGKFGPCWAFHDENRQFTGKFVGAFPENSKTLERKGFKEGHEWADAYSIITGTGTGLSGRAWVVTLREDKGYPKK